MSLKEERKPEDETAVFSFRSNRHQTFEVVKKFSKVLIISRGGPRSRQPQQQAVFRVVLAL